MRNRYLRIHAWEYTWDNKWNWSNCSIIFTRTSLYNVFYNVNPCCLTGTRNTDAISTSECAICLNLERNEWSAWKRNPVILATGDFGASYFGRSLSFWCQYIFTVTKDTYVQKLLMKATLRVKNNNIQLTAILQLYNYTSNMAMKAEL